MQLKLIYCWYIILVLTGSELHSLIALNGWRSNGNWSKFQMYYVSCLHYYIGVREEKTGINLSFSSFVSLFQFVAHPHCQQLLIKRFYGHMSYMRDWGMTKQMGVSFLLLICYPALSLGYIFSSNATVLHFVRTP